MEICIAAQLLGKVDEWQTAENQRAVCHGVFRLAARRLFKIIINYHVFNYHERPDETQTLSGGLYFPVQKTHRGAITAAPSAPFRVISLKGDGTLLT